MTRAKTASEIVAADVTEAQFLATVIDLARMLGWLTYHTLQSKGSEAGFPDLIMLRGTRCIVAELKREGAKAEPEQEAWLEAFRLVLDYPDKQVFLWHPTDIEQVKKVLQ